MDGIGLIISINFLSITKRLRKHISSPRRRLIQYELKELSRYILLPTCVLVYRITKWTSCAVNSTFIHKVYRKSDAFKQQGSPKTFCVSVLITVVLMRFNPDMSA